MSEVNQITQGDNGDAPQMTKEEVARHIRAFPDCFEALLEFRYGLGTQQCVGPLNRARELQAAFIADLRTLCDDSAYEYEHVPERRDEFHASWLRMVKYIGASFARFVKAAEHGKAVKEMPEFDWVAEFDAMSGVWRNRKGEIVTRDPFSGEWRPVAKGEPR